MPHSQKKDGTCDSHDEYDNRNYIHEIEVT